MSSSRSPSPSRASWPCSSTASGNRLWVLNLGWAIFLTGLLAFSGVSARLRNLAARLGRSWFLTIGLYVVMYLAVVFVIDLPLSFYEGFVRLHAYGLSNQTLEQVDQRLGDRAWRLDGRRVRPDLGPLPAPGAQPPALVALHDGCSRCRSCSSTMLIVPIWIDPLFNKFGPMKDKCARA